MTTPRVLVALVLAAMLGASLGMLGGDERRLSVELWFIGTFAVLAWVVVSELTRAAPVRPDRVDLWFLRSRKRATSALQQARSLTIAEGLVASSTRNSRAATLRLRPRLIDLTGELLRTRHGIGELSSERAAAVLGDVAWIVDQRETITRPPTAVEIELLIDRALDTDERSASAPEQAELDRSDEREGSAGERQTSSDAGTS